jgi:Raf kinase inhibitor-like YbhB/YbcL family protein
MPEDQNSNGLENARTGQTVSLAILVLVIFLIVGFLFFHHSKDKFKPIKQEGQMQITSSAFKDDGSIPKIYTCQSQNINPPLTFNDVPSSAQSLVLILHDPDAPSGDFTHWLMWNIPVSTTDIKANSVPAGAMQGQNDFNKISYGGPCPPSGTHHYYFDLYALNIKLDLPETSERKDVEQAMQGHIVGQTSLVGTFNK